MPVNERRNKNAVRVNFRENVTYTMLQHLLKHFKKCFKFIMHVNLKQLNKIDVNSESD